MLARLNLSTVLLILIYHAYLIAGSPINNGALHPGTGLALTPQTPANISYPLSAPASNDWENFAIPIPNTRQILKGRIFPSRPVQPRALHSMLDGGLAQVQLQAYHLGSETRLRIRDNPYTYGVPGCHFMIRSKTRLGKPTMTYWMVRNVFLALEKVLEKANRDFEASFVLTDADQVTWGHGEIWEKAPSSLLVE
ncbi:MAG: hypothetical protein Q9184_002560 [Pyrenodesmia sp. 2 TL-2023]